MNRLNIKINFFNIFIATAVFGSDEEYYHTRVTEAAFYGTEPITYYINLHKDPRFTCVDFRFPPDEKRLSPEEFKIKTAEFNSYEQLKDCQQPSWKLHQTTLESLIELVGKL